MNNNNYILDEVFVKSGIIEVENTYPDLDYPEYHKLIYYTFLLKKKKKKKRRQTPTPSHRTQLYIANGKHVFCAQPTELVSYLLADS